MEKIQGFFSPTGEKFGNETIKNRGSSKSHPRKMIFYSYFFPFPSKYAT